MSIEAVFSEHSQIRIKERMGIDQDEVKRLLENGLYAEVATVDGGVHTISYIVVWDGVKKIPFLLIFRTEVGIRTLVTVYETFEGHRRKYGIVIRSHILNEARKKFLNNRDALIRANRMFNEASFFVVLNVRYVASDGAPKSVTIRLGRMLFVDYEQRLKSDYRLMVAEKLAAVEFEDVVIPANAGVYCIFYKKIKNKEPFFTAEL